VPDAAPRAPAPGLVQLLQIGAVCGLCIGAGVFAGVLLDRALDSSPLLAFIGLAVGILGAGAGSYSVIRPYLANASKGASDAAADAPPRAPTPKE
jgi:F0F1-type ATP synthase assembly protein I